MTDRSREQRVSLWDAVRLALWEDWESIGVDDEPAAYGEYDGYVRPPCDLLRAGRPADEAFAYLRSVGTDHVGLPGNRPATRAFADRLARFGQGAGERRTCRWGSEARG